MLKVSEFKKGFVIIFNGKILLIKDIEVIIFGGCGGFKIYKLCCIDLNIGVCVDECYKFDDVLDIVEMNKCLIFFFYIDGDEYVFMNNDDYILYNFKKDEIEDELLFIIEEI